MNYRANILGVAAAIFLMLPLTANSESDNSVSRGRLGQDQQKSSFELMIDRAAEVYSAIAKDPTKEIPESVIRNVRCIAVLPDIVTGALIIGGAHGHGLASCKTTNGAWSEPAAISLREGSIGVQAGGKISDLVLFIQSSDAEKVLKSGKLKLTGEASAVAGRYGKSLDMPKAGTVAYARTEGVYAGASVSGTRIGKDSDELEEYFGKGSDYVAILEGRQHPDTSNYSNKLTSLFP